MIVLLFNRPASACASLATMATTAQSAVTMAPMATDVNRSAAVMMGSSVTL